MEILRLGTLVLALVAFPALSMDCDTALGLLGLTRENVTEEAIRFNHRKLAEEHFPRREGVGDRQKFQDVQAAKEFLLANKEQWEQRNTNLNRTPSQELLLGIGGLTHGIGISVPKGNLLPELVKALAKERDSKPGNITAKGGPYYQKVFTVHALLSAYIVPNRGLSNRFNTEGRFAELLIEELDRFVDANPENIQAASDELFQKVKMYEKPFRLNQAAEVEKKVKEIAAADALAIEHK